MDQGPDPKRPRLWSLGGSHHAGSPLLHPNPSPTAGQLPHPPPPPSTQYHHQQRSPLAPPPHPPAPPPIDDRRQHEPDRFPPMQEHRQPPHSPALPPFQPYAPREPVIKPDPADDALPHLRRPHSTGGGTVHQGAMTPVTPHSAVPPPPHSQPYPDDRRHISFDNGPPPPMYSRQPSFQPQTPLPHPQPYDYPAQYAQHGDLPYPIQVAAASGKRKAQRASQACDMCRQLKAKCDELKPCKSCKEKNVPCKYREAVPKQQDKIASDILDALLTLQARFDSFDHRMSRVERAMARNGASVDLSADPALDDDDRPESASPALPKVEDAASASPADSAGAGTGEQPPIDSIQARNITRDMEEEKEVVPGPRVRPGLPSIPHNHTTLAAFLLKWRPISFLVNGILEAERVKYVDEFPIRQEEKRGLLRIWGRGEGLESSLRADKTDREAIRDAGAMEVVRDDVSESGAPSPADCWGGIGGSPGPIDGKPVISVQTPDFSEKVVWKYVQGFEDNIQNLHPLILPRELHAMVKVFLDTVHQSVSKQSRGATVAKFVVTPSPQSETGSKRKRSSPALEGAELPVPAPSPKWSKPVFQRSINNALVLLVLALGKIGLHKDKIPDVVPVSEATHSSPMARNGHQAPASPIQPSSPSQASHAQLAGLPSPKEGGERLSSRRSSFQGGGPSIKGGTSLKRNMDVIPGLDYFAYATDILGGQLAGTSLRHIHAYLLAGLYHGQLGRVLESYAYIKEAGYALQVKMRPSLDRFSKMYRDAVAVSEKSDNQLIFAFWTCLQLESDIIAELPLPQSHILAYEDIMPFPNTNLAQELGFKQDVLQSYLAQLYLRKKLNTIHGMLYNPDKPLPSPLAQGPESRPNIIDYIEESLDMRDQRWIPAEFKFQPTDPPAEDILSARLRAKYWGAQVITYRQFVRTILEVNFSKTMSHGSPMPESDFRSGLMVPVVGPDKDIPPEMYQYAKKGVRALIESTRAFHGLKEKRYVVTNIFGTAHAQWGNLLTLSAVFRDPTLSNLVDEHLLKELFARTIAFFKIIAQPTSALHIDLRILEGLERSLWPNRFSYADTAMDHPTGSSFSSSTSGGGGSGIHSAPPPRMHPMPPAVAGPIPAGMHSPVMNHHHHHNMTNGMSTMSPPLPSPMQLHTATTTTTMMPGPAGGSLPGPVQLMSEAAVHQHPHQHQHQHQHHHHQHQGGAAHPSMLPPMQHHPPPP
ncbi:hypothetical protein N658DRAFT_251087 [Parathielavia hyrcaniae]|uniref:Zn(2)-C6 fungal-type domain-containing protein n=1 Tax=Parathielavia hyrcaniae TaxID=113614 RepID=A0AAN6T4D5_9PEZI|nr:hypothetical protein N658DRAFT_251087 [Parathielavia hyrcaniae]